MCLSTSSLNPGMTKTPIGSISIKKKSKNFYQIDNLN